MNTVNLQVALKKEIRDKSEKEIEKMGFDNIPAFVRFVLTHIANHKQLPVISPVIDKYTDEEAEEIKKEFKKFMEDQEKGLPYTKRVAYTAQELMDQLNEID